MIDFPISNSAFLFCINLCKPAVYVDRSRSLAPDFLPFIPRFARLIPEEPAPVRPSGSQNLHKLFPGDRLFLVEIICQFIQFISDFLQFGPYFLLIALLACTDPALQLSILFFQFIQFICKYPFSDIHLRVLLLSILFSVHTLYIAEIFRDCDSQFWGFVLTLFSILSKFLTHSANCKDRL